VSIAERKQRLMSIFGNVAEIAAERMEELAGQASLRDAGTTAGIATDKLLALSSDPSFQANQQHLHLHLQPNNLFQQFNDLVHSLGNGKPSQSETSPSVKVLPSGPDPRAIQPAVNRQPAEPCDREEPDRVKRG